MFADSQAVRLPVALTLVTGETMKGCLLLNRAQKLTDVLNKPEPFIEFETHDAGTIVIAKSGIVSAMLLDGRDKVAA